MQYKSFTFRARLALAIFASALLMIALAAPQSRATLPQQRHRDSSASILYVDDDAPPGGDGMSWDTAFTFLQDALAVANAPESGITEVRVGQGTYKPDQGAGQTPGDVMASFHIADFAVRGGYAGFGALDPEARDFHKYETVLSGDLLGNDGPPGSFDNYSDNTRQIARVLDTTGTSIVEGIIFRASESSYGIYGGGLRCDGGQPQVSHCNFIYNRAEAGAGLQLWECAAQVDKCTSNRAIGGLVSVGGGIAISNGTTLITDCHFFNNVALYEFGGAIFASGLVTIERCVFIENFAGNQGGAVYTLGYHIDRYVDCDFIDNSAAWSGGAIYRSEVEIGRHCEVVNCNFKNNFASVYGGALHANCLAIGSKFIGNFSSFQGGAGFYGGGTMINCEFIRNICGGDPIGGAGAALCTPGGPGFDPCGPGTFINCTFRGNDSWGAGGAVWVEKGNIAHLINCTFASNITIGDNGGAVSGPAVIQNSVAWHNAPEQLANVVNVEFSNIQNGWTGKGNISIRCSVTLLDPTE